MAIGSTTTPAFAAVNKAKARAPMARNARQARLLPTKKPPAAAPIRRDTTTAPREVADPNDPREQRIAKLRDRLVAVLHEAPLSRTKVGVEVMQASNGDVLFAHNAAVQFNPASNTKMLTTAAAMSYLGARLPLSHSRSTGRSPTPTVSCTATSSCAAAAIRR